ncbi:MAG: hypothetical protein ACXWZE_02570 [Candidatus Binatia bacterium]
MHTSRSGAVVALAGRSGKAVLAAAVRADLPTISAQRRLRIVL